MIITLKTQGKRKIKAMRITSELVLKLNEVYHDAEGGAYESKHPEIFHEEVKHWQKAAWRFIPSDHNPLNILDLGTGTGFVPLQLLPFLKSDDTLVCSDVSLAMLDTVRRNLNSAKASFKVSYNKLEAGRACVEGGPFDIITINSVLHHLYDIERFLKDVKAQLKPGGIVIAGHEPNLQFYRTPLLVLNYKLFSMVFDPKLFLYELLVDTGLFELVRAPLGRFVSEIRGFNTIVDHVNKKLLKDRVIEKPLTGSQVSRLLDYQVPVAGRFHLKGISDIANELGKAIGGQCLYFESYGHLGKVQSQGRNAKRVEKYLKAKFPQKGSLFFAVYQN